MSKNKKEIVFLVYIDAEKLKKYEQALAIAEASKALRSDGRV